MLSWVTRLFSSKRKFVGAQSGKPKQSSRVGRHGLKKVNPKRRSGGIKSIDRTAYQAVTIYSRGTCCAAATRIKGQKFLAQHAPRLPLGGCTNVNGCHCRYQHLADRREELRRGADHGLPGQSFSQSERRHRRDRRRVATA